MTQLAEEPVPVFEGQSMTEASATGRIRWGDTPHLALALLIGPFFAQGVALYLFLAAPSLRPQTVALASLIAIFWLYRRLASPRDVKFYCIAHANFVALYATSLFGGFQSPFLPWAALAWLMGAVCLRREPARMAAAFVAGTLGLAVAQVAGGPEHHMPPQIEANVALVSTVAAFSYLLVTYSVTWVLHRRQILGQHIKLARLKQQTDAAERANGQTVDLFTQANYAIRTPLNAIIGYTEMVLEDSKGQFDAQQIGDMRRIQEACQTLLGLVGSTLDLSQIEAAPAKDGPVRPGKGEGGPADAASRSINRTLLTLPT